MLDKIRTCHIHINTCIDSQFGSVLIVGSNTVRNEFVDTSIIGYYKAFEAPLLAEDIGH